MAVRTIRRIYDYEPAYPIEMSAGSVEKQNTAWNKVILEIERIYRLINSEFAFFKDLINGLIQWITDVYTDLDKRLNKLDLPIGTIVAYSGDVSYIPDGWHLCDGTGGTPDLRDRFLMGTANAGDVNKYVSAGLPNITGEHGPIQHINAPLQGSSGALYTPGSTRPYGTSTWGDYEDTPNQYVPGEGYFRISFDASKSNPIYGNSDTVMPNSYIVYYIMRMS